MPDLNPVTRDVSFSQGAFVPRRAHMFLFSKRRRSLEVIPQRIRRILDKTVETSIGDDEPRRRSRRYTRFMPALLAPWRDGGPIADVVCFALTRNISDTGVGLILPKPFESRELCL